MSRILVIIFMLLANKVAAGYHVAFNKGFAEFAQQQGFKDFNDFLLKRETCGSLILNSNKNLNNKENNNRVGLLVDPPSGYHWMNNKGIFTLMKNPTNGYVKHPNSSLTIKVSLYPNFLSEPQRPVQDTDDTSEKTLEVDPPIGHHWMSNGKSYSLMKNPISGYGPHPGSSLKAKFSIFSRASVNVNAINAELTSEKDIPNKASNLLFELILNQNTKFLSDLFVKIDKNQWNANNCKLAMFIETNILTDILESTLTGDKTIGSKVKKPKPKNDYGYGY